MRKEEGLIRLDWLNTMHGHTHTHTHTHTHAHTHTHTDPGVTTEDVLSMNKRRTGYRVDQYNTDDSRDCKF